MSPNPETEKPAASLDDAVKATEAAKAEVERIDGEIGTVRAQYADHEADADALVVDAMDGKRNAYDKAIAARDAATTRIELLTRARRLAEDKVTEAKAAQLRAAGAARKGDIKRVLASRAKAVAELVTKIEETARLWDLVNEKSALLITSWPVGTIPGGAMTNPRDLEIALEEELLRLSSRNNPLPGAHTTDFMRIDRVETLRPFAEKIAEADAYLLRTLDGVSLKPKPAPAAPAPASTASPASPEAPASGQKIRADSIPRKTVKLA